MSSETSSDPTGGLSSVLQTPEQVAAFLDGLTFTDDPLAPHELPPVLAEGEDALVPRSFKLPQRLDAALARAADARRISKSEIVRQYLETAVAADLAVDQDGDPDVLIPLADALRALTALRHLPRTA